MTHCAAILIFQSEEDRDLVMGFLEESLQDLTGDRQLEVSPHVVPDPESYNSFDWVPVEGMYDVGPME
jgi:hypothetical protein